MKQWPNLPATFLALTFTMGFQTAGSAPAHADKHGAHGAIAEFIDAKGKKIGEATLTEVSDGVAVAVKVSGLPPGPHGFHIHTTGACETPDFKSAGGHYNPGKDQHGLWNPKGAHAGDLPNLVVPESGKVDLQATARGVTLKDGQGTLFPKGGTALVIHAGLDDNRSDPAGDAGARIACAVIKKAAKK